MLGIALIIIAALFTILAAAASGIAFTLGSDAVLREQYQFLAIVHAYRFQMGILSMVSLAVAGTAGVWHQILGRKQQPILVLTQGPGGELIERATIAGLHRELEDAAAEKVREAEDYFNAAERDYAASRFQDAARSYQKSVDVIPTMSGFLNLGNSLYFISDFTGAGEAYISGLGIARSKKDRQFEGLFLSGTGLVDYHQGRLDQALESHQAVLQRDRETGNRQGEANALGNIGNVYRQQGKLVEALDSHQAALEIKRKIGNRLGEAKSLGNIGNVYFHQGKLDEALESLQAVLKIFEQITNRLGEATALGNIGNVYTAQGKLREALDSHQASLIIDREIGNRLGEAEDLNNIGRVYEDQGNRVGALEHYQQAREIFGDIGAAIQMQTVEDNVARVQTRMEAAQ